MQQVWDFLGIDPATLQLALEYENRNHGKLPEEIHVGQLDLRIFGIKILVDPNMIPGSFEFKHVKEANHGEETEARSS